MTLKAQLVRHHRWLLLIAVVAIATIAITLFGDVLSLQMLKEHRQALLDWRDAHYLLAAASFVAIYIAVTALSIPGAAVLTLAGGALFGLVVGTALVSLASTTGALLAFLLARFVLQQPLERKYGDKLRTIHAGVAREGSLYLFAMRLVPAFPFFVINVLFGLTRMRAWTFYWVSAAGMLPGTIVYIWAGVQLGTITALGDIVSWQLLSAFALLGIVPLLLKHVVRWLQARRNGEVT